MAAAFWDKRAQGYDQDVREHDAQFEKTIDRIRSLLNDLDVVLDFACASGEFSLVHGIDLSEKMIELANHKPREREAENARFEQIDLLDARLAPESFSAVVAFNIFHLLNDPAGAVARLHELLQPGGLLISQTLCLGERGWFVRAAISLAHKLGIVPAIHKLTFPELEALVSGGGFEIVQSEPWDHANMVQWIAARK